MSTATPFEFDFSASDLEEARSYVYSNVRRSIVRESLGEPFDSGDNLPDLWTIDQLAHRPKPNWLIRHVVEEKGLTVFFGPDKVGKTAVLSNLLWSWANGDPHLWDPSLAMADPSSGERRVLYVLLEGQATFYQRYDAWRATFGDPNAQMDNFLVVDEGLALFDQGMRWDKPDSWSTSAKKLWNALEKYRPAILVVDTLSRATAGMNENSPEMANVVGFLDYCRDVLGTATVLVHHVALDAGDRPRGHSSLKGAASSYVRIDGKPDDPYQTMITGPHRNAASYNPDNGKAKSGWRLVRKQVKDSFVMSPGVVAQPETKLDALERLVREKGSVAIEDAQMEIWGSRTKAIYNVIKKSEIVYLDEFGRLREVTPEEVEEI